MLIRQPFFGTLAASLNVVMTTGISGGASTDGAAIHCDPNWIASQTDSEITAVLTEMVMHVALRHHIRMRGKEADRWNRASDQAAFHALLRAGVVLRQGATPVPAYSKLNAEQIYALMAPDQGTAQPPRDASAAGQPNAQSPEGDMCAGDSAASDELAGDQGDLLSGNAQSHAPGPQGTTGAAHSPGGQPGDVMAPPADVDSAAAEQAVRHRVMLAAKATKGRGRLPAALEAEIADVLRHRTDWRSHLVHWMQERSAADYSWRRPNPRYIPLGLYLPALRTESMGAIVFAIDTSGSIDQDMLDQAASEASALCAELEPRAMHVVYCDAAIQRVETYERGDEMKFRPAGGGGTDFRPVFDWVERLDEPPAGVVFVTDGAGIFPTSEPECPVLWLVNSPVVAPFGETVRTN